MQEQKFNGEDISAIFPIGKSNNDISTINDLSKQAFNTSIGQIQPNLPKRTKFHTGEIISKSELTARQEAIEEMSKHEKEELIEMFNIDYIELDKIIEDWNYERGHQTKLKELVIDFDFL